MLIWKPHDMFVCFFASENYDSEKLVTELFTKVFNNLFIAVNDALTISTDFCFHKSGIKIIVIYAPEKK